MSTTESSWRYRPPQASAERGAQNDLLIDRRDQTINLCEMKFSDAEFTIDKQHAAEPRHKRGIFRKATTIKKNVFLALVTTFGVTDNAYAKKLVAKSLTVDALF